MFGTKSPLLRLLVVLTHVSLVLSSCYSPNGTFVPDDFPCFPDQEDSICCPAGYACLSNHLCHVTPASTSDWHPSINQTTKFSRRGCTDPTWRSSECPSFCRAYNGIAGEGVDLCDAATEQYCCTFSTDDSCTCLFDNEYVLIANATTVTVIPGTMTGPSTDSLATSTTRSAAARTTSTASTTSSSSSSSSTSSSGPTSSGTSSSSAPTSTPTTNASTGGGTNTTAIAVGVVVPVVVIAAAVVAGYFLWRRHQNKTPRPSTYYDAGVYMGESRGVAQVTH